ERAQSARRSPPALRDARPISTLQVIHVTTRIGLLDAVRRIDPPLVQRTISRGIDALERAGIARPRVGVCGINPHAGEDGLIPQTDRKSTRLNSSHVSTSYAVF